MDIAFRAASEAKAFVTAEGAHSFLVAESPKLPFQAGSFGLIVDRAVGAIAPAARTRYFQEVDRLLKPGGLVLAYFHRPARGARSAWQRLVTAGPRRVVRWVAGKRGHRGLNPQMIRDLLPGSIELVSLAESALQPRTGARFTYALLRKASQAN
jgi:SAM-dependent methyltransferase